MGRIILVAALFISSVAYGQTPLPRMVPVYSMYGARIIEWRIAPIRGYTKISARYQWIAGAFDSTLTVPSGATASLRTLGYNAPGGLFYQTSDSSLYAYTGTQWRVVSGGGAGWNLTGNSGTNPATDGVGTTDGQPLVFKVNNQKAGRIEYDGNINTFFGYRSGDSVTQGWNTAFGWETLSRSPAGESNTAFGGAALWKATSNENTAVGFGALANVTNHRNVAVGTSAMVNSRDALENTVVGNYVMLANRQGDNNNAFGSSALRGNADGGSNVAIGNVSLTQNTTSVYSVSVTAGGSGYGVGDTVLTVSAPLH